MAVLLVCYSTDSDPDRQRAREKLLAHGDRALRLSDSTFAVWTSLTPEEMTRELTPDPFIFQADGSRVLVFQIEGPPRGWGVGDAFRDAEAWVADRLQEPAPPSLP